MHVAATLHNKQTGLVSCPEPQHIVLSEGGVQGHRSEIAAPCIILVDHRVAPSLGLQTTEQQQLFSLF